jgi:AdoMet-dependent rRNA methyltransferase SPB1
MAVEVSTLRGLNGQHYLDLEPIFEWNGPLIFAPPEISHSLLHKCPQTTEEVKVLCQDLKVLGKGDFRTLVRWRDSVIKWLEQRRKVDAAAAMDEAQDGAGEKEAASDDGDSDEELNAELADAQAIAKARIKRQRRIRSKMKLKLREQVALRVSYCYFLVGGN